MACLGRFFSILLVTLLTASSLIMVESANAQTIPKPSVPEFTLYVVESSMEVTIRNQPLTPYENGSYPGLYYVFRYGDNNTRIGSWNYDPIYFVLPSTFGGYHKASDSDFTIISLSLEGKQFPSGQIGVQVGALIGNQYPTKEQNGTVYGFDGVFSGWSNPQTIALSDESVSPSPIPEFPFILAIPILLSVLAVALALRKKKPDCIRD